MTTEVHLGLCQLEECAVVVRILLKLLLKKSRITLKLIGFATTVIEILNNRRRPGRTITTRIPLLVRGTDASPKTIETEKTCIILEECSSTLLEGNAIVSTVVELDLIYGIRENHITIKKKCKCLRGIPVLLLGDPVLRLLHGS